MQILRPESAGLKQNLEGVAAAGETCSPVRQRSAAASVGEGPRLLRRRLIYRMDMTMTTRMITGSTQVM